MLLSTNNGDHLYGLSQQEQRLLAGLYSWHTENAEGNHSRLFPLPLGPGIMDNAGWMRCKSSAGRTDCGDESAKRHGEKDRLTLMGRIRTESHAKWPKSGGSGQFLRSWRVSVCVRERQQTSRWVGRVWASAGNHPEATGEVRPREGVCSVSYARKFAMAFQGQNAAKNICQEPICLLTGRRGRRLLSPLGGPGNGSYSHH